MIVSLLSYSQTFFKFDKITLYDNIQSRIVFSVKSPYLSTNLHLNEENISRPISISNWGKERLIAETPYVSLIIA